MCELADCTHLFVQQIAQIEHTTLKKHTCTIRDTYCSKVIDISLSLPSTFNVKLFVCSNLC